LSQPAALASTPNRAASGVPVRRKKLFYASKMAQQLFHSANDLAGAHALTSMRDYFELIATHFLGKLHAATA
jgi:hypothetical protein